MFTLLYVLVEFLKQPLSLTLGYINYIEFLTTIVPNEPFLNTYYFWWINLIYVFFFFSSIVVLFFNRTSVRKPLLLIGCIFFAYEFWFTELRSILSSNPQLALVSTLNPSINLLLTNTLNKYHPFIFYSSLVVGTWLLIAFITSFFRPQNFLINICFNRILISSNSVIVLSSSALALGSWWALQEGTWGGWWNWDSSEVFGLLPVLLLLRFYHTPSNDYFAWRFVIHLLIIYFTIIFFYFMLQLNFDFISHNFGSKFFFFFNANTMSINLLISSNLLLITLLNTTYVTKDQLVLVTSTTFSNFSSYFKSTYSTILLNALFSSWVYLSFISFVQFLPFSHLLIPSSTPLSSIFFLNIVLLLLITLNLLEITDRSLRQPKHPYSGIPVSISTSFNPFLTLNHYPSLMILHLMFLWFTYLNLLLYDITFYSWFSNSSDFLDVKNCLVLSTTDSIANLDTWQLDSSFYTYNNTIFSSTNWFTKNITNSFLSNKFMLLTDFTGLTNYYNLTSTYTTIYLTMGIVSLPIALVIFVITLRLFHNFSKQTLI
jgi:hypothetical protein